MLLAAPKLETPVPRKVVVWTVVAILILCGGFIASLVALNQAQRWAAGQKRGAINGGPAGATTAPGSAADDRFVQNEFASSAPKLEKAADGALVYVVGTIENRASRQRFGVRVEIELLDGSGVKVGTAKDYQAIMEPGGQWRFKALVVEPKGVASAKISAITEDR